MENYNDDKIIEGEKSNQAVSHIATRRIGFSLLGGVALSIVLVAVVYFGDYLGAAVIKFNSPRIAVKRGEKISLVLSAEQITKLRSVVICPQRILKYSCQKINYTTKKNTIEMTMPAKFPLGRAEIRLLGIKSNGKQIVLGLKALLVKVADVVSSSGSGGRSGGGSSDGGSGNSSSSNPPEPYSPYSGDDFVSLPCPPEYYDVNGDYRLTEVDAQLITNYLNGGTQSVLPNGAVWQNQDNPLDVTDDGKVNPLDVLTVINKVNQKTGDIERINCPPAPYGGR